ncbi:hypothetical protein ABZ698_38580, partial [Streptomyces antibioticus]
HRKVPAWFGPEAVGKGAAHSGNLANGLPVLLAAVRSLNRLEFIGETLRAVLEALAAAAPDWLRASMDPAWQERYGARVDAYRLPTDEQERRTLARQIATDGYRLLEAVFAPAAPGWLQQVPAVTVLRTVWVQQFTRTVTDGEEEVTWRGKDDLPPSRALSPFHPEVAGRGDGVSAAAGSRAGRERLPGIVIV